eukprot:TRINITY_DN33004_c0_g1_i3.p1 TRINITY_DN33004_c0_g1~~TRINITY_DN33004_c0_g1_i3.p1  ORF type:complete len:1398 (-),score=286.77 TRINITY_DN33004_c0_g1_i3:206-4399(-)
MQERCPSIAEYSVEIEHCVNCHQHAKHTNHDEEKYRSYGRCVYDAIHDEFNGLKVRVNPGPSALVHGRRTWQRLPYPRCGTFEVVLVRRSSDRDGVAFDAGRSIHPGLAVVLFSKLKEGKWPMVGDIIEEIRGFLVKSGCVDFDATPRLRNSDCISEGGFGQVYASSPCVETIWEDDDESLIQTDTPRAGTPAHGCRMTPRRRPSTATTATPRARPPARPMSAVMYRRPTRGSSVSSVRRPQSASMGCAQKASGVTEDVVETWKKEAVAIQRQISLRAFRGEILKLETSKLEEDKTAADAALDELRAKAAGRGADREKQRPQSAPEGQRRWRPTSAHKHVMTGTLNERPQSANIGPSTIWPKQEQPKRKDESDLQAAIQRLSARQEPKQFEPPPDWTFTPRVLIDDSFDPAAIARVTGHHPVDVPENFQGTCQMCYCELVLLTEENRHLSERKWVDGELIPKATYRQKYAATKQGRRRWKKSGKEGDFLNWQAFREKYIEYRQEVGHRVDHISVEGASSARVNGTYSRDLDSDMPKFVKNCGNSLIIVTHREPLDDLPESWYIEDTGSASRLYYSPGAREVVPKYGWQVTPKYAMSISDNSLPVVKPSLFSKHFGRAGNKGDFDDDLLLATVSPQEAMEKCLALEGCVGFTYYEDPVNRNRLKAHFKGGIWQLDEEERTWTSFHYHPCSAVQFSETEFLRSWTDSAVDEQLFDMAWNKLDQMDVVDTKKRGANKGGAKDKAGGHNNDIPTLPPTELPEKIEYFIIRQDNAGEARPAVSKCAHCKLLLCSSCKLHTRCPHQKQLRFLRDSMGDLKFKTLSRSSEPVVARLYALAKIPPPVRVVIPDAVSELADDPSPRPAAGSPSKRSNESSAICTPDRLASSRNSFSRLPAAGSIISDAMAQIARSPIAKSMYLTEKRRRAKERLCAERELKRPPPIEYLPEKPKWKINEVAKALFHTRTRAVILRGDTFESPRLDLKKLTQAVTKDLAVDKSIFASYEITNSRMTLPVYDPVEENWDRQTSMMPCMECHALTYAQCTRCFEAVCVDCFEVKMCQKAIRLPTDDEDYIDWDAMSWTVKLQRLKDLNVISDTQMNIHVRDDIPVVERLYQSEDTGERMIKKPLSFALKSDMVAFSRSVKAHEPRKAQLKFSFDRKAGSEHLYEAVRATEEARRQAEIEAAARAADELRMAQEYEEQRERLAMEERQARLVHNRMDRTPSDSDASSLVSEDLPEGEPLANGDEKERQGEFTLAPTSVVTQDAAPELLRNVEDGADHDDDADGLKSPGMMSTPRSTCSVASMVDVNNEPRKKKKKTTRLRLGSKTVARPGNRSGSKEPPRLPSKGARNRRPSKAESDRSSAPPSPRRRQAGVDEMLDRPPVRDRMVAEKTTTVQQTLAGA